VPGYEEKPGTKGTRLFLRRPQFLDGKYIMPACLLLLAHPLKMLLDCHTTEHGRAARQGAAARQADRAASRTNVKRVREMPGEIPREMRKISGWWGKKSGVTLSQLSLCG
jgi:hypothetical protein